MPDTLGCASAGQQQVPLGIYAVITDDTWTDMSTACKRG